MANKIENPNYMTKTTQSRIRKELENIDQEILQHNIEIGEAAGRGSDWHDNFAFEQANRDYELSVNRKDEIRKQLEGCVLIEAKQTTDSISLGNKIKIRFAGDDQDEEITLLGQHDFGTNQSWISYESPLGKSILDKKAGDEVVFNAGSRSIRVNIVAVEPGDFE